MARTQAITAGIPDKRSDIRGLLFKKGSQPSSKNSSIDRLLKIYNSDAEPHREGFTILHEIFTAARYEPYIVFALRELGIDLSKFNSFFQQPSFDTSYEELTDIGLSTCNEKLYAMIHLKKIPPYTTHSSYWVNREYVSFYADPGIGWLYIGTTCINVFNQGTYPEQELHAGLPTDFPPLQKLLGSREGRMKIRAILSWNQPPSPGNADFRSYWGDRKDYTLTVSGYRILLNAIVDRQS